jgi:DNA polymerase bacteriophage-type
MHKVYLDFETRSEIELTETGSALYADHSSTDILCLGYSTEIKNHGHVTSSVADKDSIISNTSHHRDCLTYLAKDSNVIFVAHNALFEERIWHSIMHKRYGYPDIPTHRWQCTMAKAYANGLPGSLKKVAQLLELSIQKDLEGREATLSLSKPKPKRKITFENIRRFAKEDSVDVAGIKKTNWQEYAQREDVKALFDKVRFWTKEEKPDKFQRMYEYCGDDVAICRLIDMQLPDLDPIEEATWHFDQDMNKSGLLIDRPLVEKIVDLVEDHNKSMLVEFKTITGLNSPRQRAKLKSWFAEQGIDLENTQKQTIAEIKTDSPIVTRAIEIVKELSKSSVAKYYTMLEMSTEDGLIREIDQYHAAHTGRYGGRGVQFQNLPRTKPLMNIEEIIQYPYGELIIKYPDLMAALSSLLRQMVIPHPGCEFLIGDFAQMEARVLAWLAGEEWVLEAFRAGKDLYCLAATDIFGYPVTKEMTAERQIGKVADLALGYQGGIGAFGNMAKGYGCDLHPIAEKIWNGATEEEQYWAEKTYNEFYLPNATEPLDEAEGFTADIIKQRWRKAHPQIKKFWKYLETASKEAIEHGISSDGRWRLEGNFLYCQLPSGRLMAYPFPRIEWDGQLSYYSESVEAKKAGYREYTYGGKLSENITQAVQRDLLRDAMLNMVAEYRKPLFHVHDEIVIETPHALIEKPKFEGIMKRPNPWAPGLPIDVDAVIAKRYKK